MKPTGIVDYLFPWFIPLFCFFAGYFIGTVVQVKIEPLDEYTAAVYLGWLEESKRMVREAIAT